MKNESMFRKGIMTFALLLTMLVSHAQDGSFSIQQAIDYAITHNLNVKNSQLDALSADAKIGEVRAVGLPQVSASASLMDNLIIQKAFLPASFFGGKDGDPPIVASFGVSYQGSFGATLNQLIFNGTYLVGLKAAATYRELAQKAVSQSKISVAEVVTKAYYSVQVAEERAKVLDLNIARVDSLLLQTKEMNKNGFVELLDVNRLEVQVNNLTTEKQKVENLIALSYNLLKYQMGMPLSEPVILTDKIEDINADVIASELDSPQVNYNNRIEYSLLETQGKLAYLDLKSIKSGYLPSLSASLGYGHNNGRDRFGDLMSSKWYNNSVLSLNLQIPIFDGFSKKYQVQQKQIALDKVKIGQTLLEQSIDLETNQAAINTKNAYKTLKTQQANLDLAKEVARVTRIKYKEGVGSNIEVIDAESSLKEAQTNYFASLYDLIIAKVDLSKAKGELYTNSSN